MGLAVLVFLRIPQWHQHNSGVVTQPLIEIAITYSMVETLFFSGTDRYWTLADTFVSYRTNKNSSQDLVRRGQIDRRLIFTIATLCFTGRELSHISIENS